MIRAVLDPNVLIAALLSRDGTPAQLLRRWIAGDFEIVVSAALLAELERALAYPKLARRIAAADAAAFVSLLHSSALTVADPSRVPTRSSDPGDDYLLALAQTAKAYLVSGDKHLLELAGTLPVYSPRELLRMLA